MRNVAVITGASRGIGRAAALLFAENGADLALCCRANSDLLTEVKDEAEKRGASCLTFTGDLGDPAVCRSFFSEVTSSFSRVDCLINNAGISFTGLFQDMTPDEWRRIWDSNVSSVFYCCQQALPIMLKQGGGRIVNVSSVWGAVGGSCEAAYSATKGAVNSLTKALARELAPSHICVNAAAFGAIDTDMNARLSSEERAALEEEISLGRMGTPQEAAALLWQLATAPEYLTGQIVTMDGAWY